MAYSISVLLIALSAGTLLMSCLFKLENCFPFQVDPSSLHGSRLHSHDRGGMGGRFASVVATIGNEFGLQASMGGRKGGAGSAGSKYSKVLDDSLHAMP
jgi:hypothetical protein